MEFKKPSVSEIYNNNKNRKKLGWHMYVVLFCMILQKLMFDKKQILLCWCGNGRCRWRCWGRCGCWCRCGSTSYFTYECIFTASIIIVQIHGWYHIDFLAFYTMYRMIVTTIIIMMMVVMMMIVITVVVMIESRHRGWLWGIWLLIRRGSREIASLFTRTIIIGIISTKVFIIRIGVVIVIA